jgi:NET1-associated nuclear protein 1 (U3 small nucleolar RNA-associated protein 17)
VLVLWQLDTGRQQYLPHLSATIRNIVVSPRGTSYAIHLEDNSTMILSTSELVPTANIAGIQAHVLGNASNPDSRVERVNDDAGERLLLPRCPAVINPARPQILLLAVGEVQEINPRSSMASSAPFLQTFDIASNHNISRQAMTRTNITNKNIAPSAHRISEPVITHIQISHDGAWLATIDEWLPPKHDLEFLSHGGMNIEDEQRRRREVYLKFWQLSKSEESWALVTRIDAPHTMALEKHGAGRVLSLAADPISHTFSTLGEDGIVQIWRPRTRKRDGVIVRGADGEPLCTWSCQRRVSLGSATMDDDSIVYGQQISSHGSLAFSDDGSLLASAISGHEAGLVHLIDPINGTIQSSRPLMYRGDLISMAFLAQYLIILSDELRIYDLVLDEFKYGIALGDAKDLLSLQQKAEMMHLTVDRSSHTFAIALPYRTNLSLSDIISTRWLSKAYSELAVFDPRQPAPLHTQRHPYLITALIPALSSPGYILLDAAAEITTVSPKATQTLSSIAKPMVELRLDIRGESEVAEGPAVDLTQLAETDSKSEIDAEAGIEEQLVDPATGQPPGLNYYNDIDGDDDGPAVVTQHQLASVLDVGPSFALPPIEELFYAVAGLFSGKPKVQKIS